MSSWRAPRGKPSGPTGTPATAGTGTSTSTGAGAGGDDDNGQVSVWRGTRPELTIAAITVAAAALAGGVLAGWPGVAAVAIATAALAMVVLRGLAPRSAAQSVRRSRDRQVARVIAGYAQRRFIVSTSVSSRAFYEADLRPVLEHLLAARLAENHGINLYMDPAAARSVFCRSRGDAALWSWVDPARPPVEGRAAQRSGIPRRTLARLINRLEHL